MIHICKEGSVKEINQISCKHVVCVLARETARDTERGRDRGRETDTEREREVDTDKMKWSHDTKMKN